MPEKVTMDKSGANKAGIDRIHLLLTLVFLFRGIFHQIIVRQIKYLNTMVEQNHRGIKKITKPMKGFKSFAFAEATITGIELHHKSTANLPVYEQFYALAA